ncbi:MAG: glycosyltransferase family 4 protein [Myxococcota bacterium]|nr:glycosyltransferase family 4 protein [Myxococcota bacterium]
MSIHILHITRDYPPHYKGGISTAVLGMTRALTARGVKVSIISFDGWRPKSQTLSDAPLQHETQGAVSIGRLHAPSQLESAHCFACELAPTHIHVHHDMLWAFARRVREQTKAPAYLTVHVLQKMMNQVRGVQEETLSLRAQEEAFREADLIFSPSNTTTEDLLELYPDLPRRIRTTPLGHYPSPLDPCATTRDSHLTILFVGRFDTVKGTHLLFDAMASLSPRLPDIHWKVVGGIPGNPKGEKRWRRKWTERAAPGWNVSLSGWLPPTELHTLYKQSDILIAPSLYETFGLSVLEAMSHGLGICAFNAGGLQDLLLHQECALLSQSGDTDSLHEHIETMVKNINLRRTLGQNASHRARTLFHWDQVIEKLLDAYGA